MRTSKGTADVDTVRTGDGRSRHTAGVSRLVRRLERERRAWVRRPGHDPVATEVAWRAGVAEGLRLAQQAIRKGV